MVANQLEDEVFTALPATVIDNKDFSTEQKIIIQPVLNKVVTGGIVLKTPPIFEVPVVMPSAGGGHLTFPIQNGDTVLAVFCKRSLDEFLNSSGSDFVTPSFDRTFSLTDAVAIVGLGTFKNNSSPSATNVELKFKGHLFKLEPDNTLTVTNGSTTLTMLPDGSNSYTNGTANITMSSGGDMQLSTGASTIGMSATGIDIASTTVTINGFTFSGGGVASGSSMSAGGISLESHTHSGVQTGSGNTGGPQ